MPPENQTQYQVILIWIRKMKFYFWGGNRTKYISAKGTLVHLGYYDYPQHHDINPYDLKFPHFNDALLGCSTLSKYLTWL